MKPNPPAPLLSYILKYLQYIPDPKLHYYREEQEQYEEELKNTLHDEFIATVSKTIAMVENAYILGRLFTVTVAIAVFVFWACAPLDGIPPGHRIEIWSEATWLFYFPATCLGLFSVGLIIASRTN